MTFSALCGTSLLITLLSLFFFTTSLVVLHPNHSLHSGSTNGISSRKHATSANLEGRIVLMCNCQNNMLASIWLSQRKKVQMYQSVWNQFFTESQLMNPISEVSKLFSFPTLEIVLKMQKQCDLVLNQTRDDLFQHDNTFRLKHLCLPAYLAKKNLWYFVILLIYCLFFVILIDSNGGLFIIRLLLYYSAHTTLKISSNELSFSII